MSAGTLLVGAGGSGALGGPVEVELGGTLGGSGTISGNATVDGTLAAGNSPGTLTFEGNLTLGSGSTTKFELNGPGVVGGPANDHIVVEGLWPWTARWKQASPPGASTGCSNMARGAATSPMSRSPAPVASP